MPLLKYVPLFEAEYIMRQIHVGICENHAWGQSLVFKTLKQGYYQPIMKANCMEFSRKCDRCQQFAPISKAHPEDLTIMTSLWPFAMWRIDLIGQLPKGRESVHMQLQPLITSPSGQKPKHSHPSRQQRLKSSCIKTLSAYMGCHTLSYRTMANSSTVMSSRNSAIISRRKKCSLRQRDLKLTGKSKPSTR